MVCCGDFYQLPPVGLGTFGKGFAFDAPAWAAARLKGLVLVQPVRQQGDAAFARLLSEVRGAAARLPRWRP